MSESSDFLCCLPAPQVRDLCPVEPGGSYNSSWYLAEVGMFLSDWGRWLYFQSRTCYNLLCPPTLIAILLSASLASTVFCNLDPLHPVHLFLLYTQNTPSCPTGVLGSPHFRHRNILPALLKCKSFFKALLKVFLPPKPAHVQPNGLLSKSLYIYIPN